MAEITLPAHTGRPTGSGPSKRLRAEGKVPATVYGLIAEKITVPNDRSWVEFGINPHAIFHDGSPIAVTIAFHVSIRLKNLKRRIRKKVSSAVLDSL